MKRLYALLLTIFIFCSVNGQITTSGINGVVTEMDGVPLVGATVIALHMPSGSQYEAVTNNAGRYSIQGMRTGGPYTVAMSFVGYETMKYTDITLLLGETLSRNAQLEDIQELDAVMITADGRNSPMNINRAGAITSISMEQIEMMPTTNRSMNDIMKLTPQASFTTSGLAIAGGNYRQSYVTVDGAAFNNAFGIGGNLPSGGTPISLDALEQILIAITPFDVRQSGFIGGSISAVTKGGTNQLKVSAYNYYKSDKLQGTRIADGKDLTPMQMFNNTFGFNIGAPIIKDKLFFFTNFEYEWNTNPAQRRKARPTEDDSWKNTQFNRPTVGKMEEIKSFLKEKFDYDPGQYQNYSTNTPGWKLMARMDWNINRNHSMNVRFSTTRTKYSSAPSSSISPLEGYDRDNNGRLSTSGLYFESSRYYQQMNFTSVAAELNSHFANGALNNILRATYSHQYEPRSFDGNLFPTVDILEPLDDGGNALYTTFGLDPFTYGSIRDVSTYVVTDEISYSRGIHNLIGGVQFEHNTTMNGYMQGGAGYYIFSSWDSFRKAVDPTDPELKNVDGTPMAFAITHANRSDLKQTFSSFDFMQFSLYFQDELNISDRLKATLGIRFETPIYPSLKNNENAEFTKLFAPIGGYKTSDMPKARVNVSPRFGMNWDMTGERKYILRGGTGIFTGRLPFVWIVSALGNSNCDQAQKILFANKKDKMPGFHTNISDILNDDAIYGGGFEQKALPAPLLPTIMDKNLRMPSTWKTSLALDLKLPAGIDLNLEGIYNQDINSIAVTKLGQIEKIGGIQLPGEPRPRKLWSKQGIKNSEGKDVTPYLINNSALTGFYYSFTAQAQKRFRGGLSLMAAYTYSQSKSVIDGIGDQVTSVYNTNTFCVDGSNTPELGYSSYVTPHRILASVSYRKEYGDHFGSSVALFYEGARQGYIGNYSYARYSYTCYTQSGNYLRPVVDDGGAQNLIYVPTDAQLQDMPFTDDLNRIDYQNFINEDKYLSSIKGEYSQRGGAVMPWFHTLNLKFAQDFFVNVRGKRNTITVGIDINNVANLVNRNWGNIKQLSTNSILSYSKASDGAMKYTFIRPTWRSHDNLISTWSALFSVRYTFN